MAGRIRRRRCRISRTLRTVAMSPAMSVPPYSQPACTASAVTTAMVCPPKPPVPPAIGNHTDGEGDRHDDRARSPGRAGRTQSAVSALTGRNSTPYTIERAVEQQPVEAGRARTSTAAANSPRTEAGQPGIGQPAQREQDGRHPAWPPVGRGHAPGTRSGGLVDGALRGQRGLLRRLPALRGTCSGLLHRANVGREVGGRRRWTRPLGDLGGEFDATWSNGITASARRPDA